MKLRLQTNITPVCLVACLLLPCLFVSAAKSDTFEQLYWAYSNIPLDDQDYRAPVTIDSGSIPTWLEGSFIRHACGVFGEMLSTEPYLNKIDHLFDCIEMGQSYVFQDGEVSFTNKYYDTNAVDVWASYGENMNISSVFFQTIIGTKNVSAIELNRDAMNNPGKSRSVDHVSWWLVDGKAIAFSEYPIGHLVDVHEVTNYGNFPWSDMNLGYPYQVYFENNPAHEQTEQDGRVWSTVGVYRFTSSSTLSLWRAVFTIAPGSKEREVVGEWDYADVDLSLCTAPGVTYPEPEGRLQYMHAFQMTENFIVLPETSALHDPCALFAYPKQNESYFLGTYTFEEEVDSSLRIMDKQTGEFVASLDIPPMFATHMLGAYEDGDLLHADLLTYNDAAVYAYLTFPENALNGATYDTYVTRYTVNTTSWTLVEVRDLIPGMPQAIEFSNINPAYQGKKYTYAYMIKNAFILDNSIVKLNVDTGETVTYELGEGEFGNEPWFIASPGATEEDDGILLVQGIDGEKKKATLTILDARDLSVISHVTAPSLSLYGLHNKFYSADVGGAPVQ